MVPLSDGEISDDNESILITPEETSLISAVHMFGLLLWTAIVLYVAIVDFSFLIIAIGTLFTIPHFLLWYNPVTKASDSNDLVENGILSISIIVIVSLLNHITDNFNGSCKAIVPLIFGSILFALLSVTDLYFGSKWMVVTKHAKMIFQTIAIGCAAMSAATYYTHHEFKKTVNSEVSVETH